MIIRNAAATLAAASLFVFGTAAANADAGSKVYKLHAQNGSREYGTVALTPKGDATIVAVHIVNAPPGVSQPAHIHMGTCATLNPAPKYPLTPSLDGTSMTTVPVSMATLMASPMAVNVHKSGPELKVYVACVDLK
ncbi:MAG: hypothetical protein NVSMB21_01970 [Vulcanimicrobiaceae bacterium]